MIKIIGIIVLLPICLLGFFMVVQAQNPLKYKYLFRNTILSKSQKYELGAVLRGRVYNARYYYVPSLKQYIVYSDVDETGDFRFYKMQTKAYGKTYALLNEDGLILNSFETNLSFSNKSGCFYGPSTFIPWLEQKGNITPIPYHKIHNKELNLDKTAFNELFVELYKTAEYVEFINLRLCGDNIHESAVVFRLNGKIEILLSSVRDGHLSRNFQENRNTNNFDDYYTLSMRDSDLYPESKPLLSIHALQTDNINPNMYWRHVFKKPFRITTYHSVSNSGWQGVMKLHGIPIYVPGNGSGTAYVRFKTKKDVFKIKILDVDKSNVIPLYNLGLRTFELPEQMRTDKSLVFMESGQNCGSNRLGGGVYVVRSNTNTNSSSDLPFGLTEKHFNTLPINLQEALMQPDSTTELIIYDPNITKWIPEIEYLKNLRQLKLTTSMTEVPDEIVKFSKLQELSLEASRINRVSPRIAELTQLNDLSLFSNKLTEFPSVLLKMKKLKRLNIGGNDIPSLPSEINQLEELEYLSMTSTNIRTLPESMIGMKKLCISDSQDLEEKLPAEYKHLFD